ncbi:MAG: B12-binding domain-containing radical SAM protein, partial [Planctomycetaceae bacterium]|nr:B12-binding domain-containing radical SAM protein [Planctomycetaceae bacterium]
MNRVLLVVPRSYNPKQMYREYPLGVGFVGTFLREKGYTVAIFDQNAEGRDDALLWNKIEEFRPDIVGFSVITPNYPVACIQIQALKSRLPELLVMAGGIHATLFPEDLLSDGVDYVILGEGEKTTPALLDAIRNGGSLDSILGIAYRENGDIRVNSRVAERVDLDAYPMVDRSLYRLDLYSHHSMVASRGCPYRCTFCCNYSGTILVKGVAVRSFDRVIDEMEVIESQFGGREVFFADDIFLLRRQEILRFCSEYVERDLSLSWIGQMRADTIDDEVASAMYAANCKRIYFGVESGSDAILSDANKRMTTEQMLSGTDCAKRAGIRVKTGWIYGLPGPLSEQRKSIDFMLRMRPHEISIHQLIPFPGTPYYNEPRKYGIRIKDPKDFKSFCYGGVSENISYDYLSTDEML